MALGSAARVPISRRLVGSNIVNSDHWLVVLWAAFLTALVGGPWLLPGYLFGTDWPGPRHLDFPTALSSSAPLQAALAAIAWAVGSEAAGKLLVLGSLFLAAAAAYGAVPIGGFLPRAAASTVYLLNPFVYGRLHYGQLFLITAYAVLPWAAVRFRRLLLQPDARSALIAALAMALLGMLDLHVFLIGAVLAISLLFAHLVLATDRLAYVRRLTPHALLGLGATLAASAYWTVPLLQGRGFEGATLSGIGTGQLISYAAVPDQHLGLLPNLLGLYGFWAEDAGRFLSMKAYVPLWPVVLAAILLVAAVGALAGIKRKQDQLTPWVIGLLIAAAIALVLEMGVSSPVTSGLVYWLDAHVSPFRGMRDAGKWAALLALAYSQLVALGAVAILDWIRRRKLSPAGIDWMAAAASALLLAIPLGYGNGLLFGSHGGIRPSQYPAGWYAADRLLLADPHHGRTLFLPWHEYLSFDFIRNENEVVASPAPSFFSTPIVVSTNPEVFGTPPSSDPAQVAISKLVSDGPMGTSAWAQVLTTYGIKYVLLARGAGAVDWKSYAYLDSTPGLVKVADFGSIALYRNSPLP
jgi:hypothetical protein